MDPVTTAALISGGSQLLSSFLGSKSSESGINATNAANAQIARENRDWQERMDNSKYQRGVEDARKAGFNPLVAFPGSASTPMPSTPTMQNPKQSRGELALSTAKATSDLLLQRELIKTEQTKQEANLADAMARRGVISIPGVGTVPIDRAVDAFQALETINQQKSKQHQDKTPKINLASVVKSGPAGLFN